MSTGRPGYWRAVHRVHRLEHPFALHYLCHAAWGACFAVAEPADLLRAPVLVAVLANAVQILSQGPLNAAADVAGDRVNPGKSGIATAVLRPGPAHVALWGLAEMAVAVTACAAVALHLDRPLVVVPVVVSSALHLMYNVEPVKLKRRGMANPAYFGMTFAVLPFLSTFAAVRSDVPAWTWPLCAGLGVLMMGRTLWWAVPDRDADAAVGVRTPAVDYGARRALLVACALTALGLVGTGWGLWWGHGAAWAVLGVLTAGLFLVDVLRLTTTITDDRLPDERSLRERTLAVVVVSDAALALLPLVAVTGAGS
ncbi:UbiA prenyltransferase family protein [Actinosynnema sp. NPDC053489]|uniref:UbiA prenyltransferase family protein n=1 Tax=Actinosynnema sp. NPDC053489 TaxID=3363916 RepID=UPI0037C64825